MATTTLRSDPFHLNISRNRRANRIHDVLHQAGFKVVNVPGDGHCLLHSIVKAWSHQVPGVVALTANQLISDIFCEFVTNRHYYTPFLTVPTGDLTHIMYNYLIKKAYNNIFADMVPIILANMLKVTINILEVQLDGQLQHFTVTPTNRQMAKYSLYIHKKNEHYSVVGLNDCIAKKDKLLAPKQNNVTLTNIYSVLTEEDDTLDNTQLDCKKSVRDKEWVTMCRKLKTPSQKASLSMEKNDF
jgi:hypothetical protein